MASNLRRELTNLPNLVTMGRVVLIPFVLIFIDNFNPLRTFIASLLYLVAAAGDFLDGYLARSRGQVSMLGKFLDPLADKLTVNAVLVFMVALGRVPAWVVVVLIGARSRGQRAAQHRVRAGAGHRGQRRRQDQDGAAAGRDHDAADSLPLSGAGRRDPGRLPHRGAWLLYLSTVVSLYSGAQYMRHFLSAAIKQSRAST